MVIFTEHLTYHKPEKCIYTLKKTISEELKNTDIQSTLKVSAAITLKIYIYIYKKKKASTSPFVIVKFLSKPVKVNLYIPFSSLLHSVKKQ